MKRFNEMIRILSIALIITCIFQFPLEAANRKQRIIMAGSSSIRRWKDAKTVFSDYKVINKAIGGTKVVDWMTLYKQRITKYKPDIVLFYCGANDIEDGTGVSGEENAANTIRLLKDVQNSQKNVIIFYISINHCYRNPHAWNVIDTSNEVMRNFCAQRKNIYYIDLVTPSLLPDGMPDPTLFKEDKLHPSEKGFGVWGKTIGRFVKRIMKVRK